MNVFQKMVESSERNEKQIAVLIDPDSVSIDNLKKTIETSAEENINYLFVGGSLIFDDCLDLTLDLIKQYSDIPSVIFPGNNMQINQKSDALLYLSLISGRNAEYLIGKHVISAPLIKKLNIETISTGYMLVDSGSQTTASYISGTQPLPMDKSNIAVSTAIAGELLGLKTIFMDGGSGAKTPISSEMISAVKNNISCPLIIGGGIKTKEKVRSNFDAGADIIVVGNAIESNPHFIREISQERFK